MTNTERKDAIRCLKLWIEREPYIQTYKTCLELLEQTTWIPCSEDLPKDNGWYHCTVTLDNLSLTMDLYYKNGKWLDNRRINMFDTYDIYGYGHTTEKHKLSYQELISEFDWTEHVVAWMPLTEAYDPKTDHKDPDKFEPITPEEMQKCKDIVEKYTPKQQHCNNAMDRQTVNTLVDELAKAISDEKCGISRGRSTATIIRDIRHLPPVTSQPKVGHWIIDLQTATEDYYICSECGRRIHLLYPDTIDNYPYCHCGARMIESKGDEE